MAAVEAVIIEQFLTSLGETEGFDSDAVDRLRQLLAKQGAKLKPDEIVKALSPISDPVGT